MKPLDTCSDSGGRSGTVHAFHETQSMGQNGLIDLSVGAWVLLVEVMYGFKVSNVVKSEGRTLLVLADESRIGTDGVEVKGRWGSPYSKAIAHCFKESTQLLNSER